MQFPRSLGIQQKSCCAAFSEKERCEERGKGGHRDKQSEETVPMKAVGRDGQLGTQLAHFTAPARELGVTTNDCSLPLEYDT